MTGTATEAAAASIADERSAVTSGRRLLTFAATAAILVMTCALPIMVGLRINGLLTSMRFEVGDIARVGWVLLVIVLLTKLLRQTRPALQVPGLRPSHGSLTSRVVEASAFGVGSLRLWTMTNPHVGLDRLTAAEPVDQLDYDIDPEEMVTQVVSEPEAASPLGIADLPKAEYVVRRGDTFWSLAEASLGHGEHWVGLLELNVGREVAEGVFLSEESVLRSGWSLLLPVGERTGADAASKT